MSIRESSDSAARQWTTTVECLTWNDVLQEASLDDNFVLERAILCADPGEVTLIYLCSVKVEMLMPMVKVFLTHLSVEEDHQLKIIAAIQKNQSRCCRF